MRHPGKVAVSDLECEVNLTIRKRFVLPYCVASAQTNPDLSMNSTRSQRLAETGKLLGQAKSAGMAVNTVTAMDLFERVTTLSWGCRPLRRRRTSCTTTGRYRDCWCFDFA